MEEDQADFAFYEEEEQNIDDQGIADDFEEFIIDDDEDSSIIVNPVSSLSATESTLSDSITMSLNICKAFFVGLQFLQKDALSFHIEIPTSFLPFTISTVNGFTSTKLLELDIDAVGGWHSLPRSFNVTNPNFGTKFPGSILVNNKIRNFFNPTYFPAPFYHAQAYIFAATGTAREKLLEQLIIKGFEKEAAEKALKFTQNNYSAAVDYLVTGQLRTSLPLLSSYGLPSYKESPISYLVLEVCEAFFDMGECCCICGKPLGIYGLKPSPCASPLCLFSFLDLGVGFSVVNEIKRDSLATDFVITCAGLAFMAPQTPPVFEPSPPKISWQFFETLPAINEISQCANDRELIEKIGPNCFETLRFFLLANRAHLATLPSSLLVDCGIERQFLLTSRSPEAELIFEEKRAKYGREWLWHGSNANRWYRILHTGLKDYNLTGYQAHGGPIYGMGIYMSNSRNYSLGYCPSAENIYRRSALPKQITVISLVENAKVPKLRKAVECEYTQQDEQACITRVLCVWGGTAPYCFRETQTDYDVVAHPPKVPTLNDILLHIGSTKPS